VEEGSVERSAGILGQRGAVDVEEDEAGNAIYHSFAPLQVSGGLALSDSERAEALADSLEAQFPPTYEPSDVAFSEI
jgi:hypothetical protein